MKKTVFFMILLAVIVTGCKKEKSKSLNYNGPVPVHVALKSSYQLSASSEYDISYSSSNNLYVTVSNDGVIFGKNVGSADVVISNGYESTTVPVNVDLFIEPTFEFGCETSYIRALYGNPLYAIYDDDVILRYIYTANAGYSWACGQMDFLFQDGKYFESQVYIREGVDDLLEKYISDNFIARDTMMIYNEYIEDSVACCVYRNKTDNTIYMGKYPSYDQWNETFMFYLQILPQDMPRQRIYEVLERKYED